MIGILVVAHGTLAASLVDGARHVMGALPERLEAVRIEPQEDPDQNLARIDALARAIDDGSGVLVLSDMCGGTPCNVASRLAAQGRRVVSGVNLPMLVRALTYRNAPLDAVMEKALSGGRDGVMPIA